MTVYRFSNKQYSEDLSGTGAKLYGGRWNHKGLAGLYTSSSISLSLLEVLVNALSLETLQSLALIAIDIPASLQTSIKVLKNLKAGWADDFEYCRYIGSEFLQNRSQLILECPSAVVPEESNFLFNPLHQDYAQVRASSITEYKFDKRLFKISTTAL